MARSRRPRVSVPGVVRSRSTSLTVGMFFGSVDLRPLNRSPFAGLNNKTLLVEACSRRLGERAADCLRENSIRHSLLLAHGSAETGTLAVGPLPLPRWDVRRRFD